MSEQRLEPAKGGGGKRREPAREGDAPRTDLPPTREPYDEGYFGTGEEEGVHGSSEVAGEEEDQPEDAAEKKTPKGEDL